MLSVSIPIHYRHRGKWLGGISALMVGCIALSSLLKDAQAQTPAVGTPMTVRSDIQEANSETGVITARGNVQVNYPARQMQATSAQAQYFSRERRLVLSGNVYVLQQGNSMRAETMTYLVDEGRFIATPQANRQVESIYIVTDSNTAPTNATSTPIVVPPSPPLAPRPPLAPSPSQP